MTKSTTVLTQKKRGPKPTGKGTLVGVRLQPDILAKVDALVRLAEPGTSRADIIRKIIHEWEGRPSARP
jgi:hypothetical protein